MQPNINASLEAIDLLSIASKSIDPQYDFTPPLMEIEKEYLNWAKSTIPVLHQSRVLSNIRFEFNKIESLCKGIQLLGEFPEKTKHRISHYPIQLAAYISKEVENHNCKTVLQ